MGQIKVWHAMLGVIMVITGLTMMEFEPILFQPRKQDAQPVALTCETGGGEPMADCWIYSGPQGNIVSCRKPDGSTARLYEDGRICTESDMLTGVFIDCTR